MMTLVPGATSAAGQTTNHVWVVDPEHPLLTAWTGVRFTGLIIVVVVVVVIVIIIIIIIDFLALGFSVNVAAFLFVGNVYERTMVLTENLSTCICRRVGRRVGVHAGHHFDGTLFRHLSPSDVAALADTQARLPHDRRRMARSACRNDAHGHLSALASHAVRRTQVCRGLGPPLLGKGIHQQQFSPPSIVSEKRNLIHTFHQSLYWQSVCCVSVCPNNDF